MLKPAIKWFHLVTGHPGERRLELSLKARFHHLGLRREISKFKCGLCQRHKLSGKDCGLLSEKEISCQPFTGAAVGLIGLWTIKVGKGLTF